MGSQHYPPIQAPGAPAPYPELPQQQQQQQQQHLRSQSYPPAVPSAPPLPPQQPYPLQQAPYPHHQQQQPPYSQQQQQHQQPPYAQQHQQPPYPQQQQQHYPSLPQPIPGAPPGHHQQQQQHHHHHAHGSSWGGGSSSGAGGSFVGTAAAAASPYPPSATVASWGSAGAGGAGSSFGGTAGTLVAPASAGGSSFSGAGSSFGGAGAQAPAPAASGGAAGPLPPYPAVPPPLPFTTPPDKVPHGYDALVYIQQASSLPAMDWWNQAADPYVVVTVAAATGQRMQYKTRTVKKTRNPQFDEFFEIGNLPAGSHLLVEVWDKDLLTEDDMIGRASWTFAPGEMAQSSTPGGSRLGGDASWGRRVVSLALGHPTKPRREVGSLELEITYRPSRAPGAAALMGPVRFKQHLSPAAGVLTGRGPWGSADATMAFSTFKLYLVHIDATFGGLRCPWNRKYDKAAAIFKHPLMLSTVRTQHASLYSTQLGASRCGVLRDESDFFSLFGGGVRAGERRYFTYCLMPDSLRCSETGAAFFSDMMSKHAMHAGGEEEVVYAGEFCIVPEPRAAGGHRLVVDNNSGTYAPDAARLPLMRQLLRANFPSMEVDVLAVGDPRLTYYQQACPSRATA